MAAIEQLGFVLHSRPYRENQLLVDLLTENEGKVSATIYVGRSSKSTQKGNLQLFLPLTISLKGHGSVKQLNHVEPLAKSFLLTGHYLYSGFYLNELLVRLLGEHVACIDLFHQYQSCLSALAERQPLEPILRQFEMSLLDELGQNIDFGPVFEFDASSFYYLPEQGFVPADIPIAAPSFDRADMQAIAQQQLDQPAVLLSYKRLMRQIIGNLMENKPLNSRKLFTRVE